MHHTRRQTRHFDKAARVAVADGCEIPPVLLRASDGSRLTDQVTTKDCSGHINSGWPDEVIDEKVDFDNMAFCE